MTRFYARLVKDVMDLPKLRSLEIACSWTVDDITTNTAFLVAP
jgi:hypothetical protein